MRLTSYILSLFFFCSILQAQELNRGSYNLRIDNAGTGESSIRLTLTQAPETILYQINREVPYDTPRPLIHLFADGSVLLVDAFAGVFERYSENGRMAERIPMDGKIRPNHERIAFLRGGDSLAVLLISEMDQPESHLLILDHFGSTLVDTRVGGPFASGLELSSDGELIAIGTYGWSGSVLMHTTEFLNRNGAVISSLDHEFKGGAWNAGDSLFLVYGRKDAAVVHAGTGVIRSTCDLGVHHVVHSVVWNNGVPLIAASPAPRLEAGQWIFPSFVVLSPGDPVPLYQSESRSFRSLEFLKRDGAVSVAVDGNPLLIPSSGKN